MPETVRQVEAPGMRLDARTHQRPDRPETHSATAPPVYERITAGRRNISYRCKFLKKSRTRVLVVASVLLTVATGCSSSSPISQPAPSATTSEVVATAPADTTVATTAIPTTAPEPLTVSVPPTTPPTSVWSAGLTVPKPVDTPCPDATQTAFACLTVAVPADYDHPDAGTVDIVVTVNRALPTTWTSPMLRMGGMNSRRFFDWKQLATAAAGHDSVWIDRRDSGRSHHITPCTGIDIQYVAGLNTDDIDPTFAGLLADCLKATKANPQELNSVIDGDLDAKDLSLVRQALGIDSWAIATGYFFTDSALRLVGLEPGHVTAMIVNDPTVTGIGATTANLNAAFDAFATGCAAAPTCSQGGDLHDLLIKALAQPPNVSTVPDRRGGFVTLDSRDLTQGIAVAMTDPSIIKLLPTLIAGAAVGGSPDPAATFYAQADPDYAMSPSTIVYNCQNGPTYHIGLTDTGSPLATGSPINECAAAGTVPQIAPLGQVNSDIPVIVIYGEYYPASSMADAKKIFAGFPNTTFVDIPGIMSPSGETGTCWGTVRDTFASNPTPTPDVACLTAAAVPTLS